jgi:hypothetical protein
LGVVGAWLHAQQYGHSGPAADGASAKQAGPVGDAHDDNNDKRQHDNAGDRHAP